MYNTDKKLEYILMTLVSILILTLVGWLVRELFMVDYMSNEQIIMETKKCEESWLAAHPAYRWWQSQYIVSITCIPK